MPLIRSPAIILHGFPYGDTSRILRLLTPEHGLRSVIAKGASASRSRFGGVLEPFTEGEAHFNLREGRELFVLSGFELVRSRQGIGRDFGAFAGASLIAELLLRFATEEPDPELYARVRTAFDRLSVAQPDPNGLAIALLWGLMTAFGFRPEALSCVVCGRTLGVRESARFDLLAGGTTCTSCGGSGRAVAPSVRLDLARMLAEEGATGPLPDQRIHGELLQSFLASHLSQGQPLRSLPLFLEQLR